MVIALNSSFFILYADNCGLYNLEKCLQSSDWCFYTNMSINLKKAKSAIIRQDSRLKKKPIKIKKK